MDIYCVLSIARQIDGEYILVKTEKAFKTPERAEAFLNELKDQYVKDGKMLPVTYATPHGDVVCRCELGVFQTVVED